MSSYGRPSNNEEQSTLGEDNYGGGRRNTSDYADVDATRNYGGSKGDYGSHRKHGDSIAQGEYGGGGYGNKESADDYGSGNKRSENDYGTFGNKKSAEYGGGGYGNRESEDEYGSGNKRSENDHGTFGNTKSAEYGGAGGYGNRESEDGNKRSDNDNFGGNKKTAEYGYGNRTSEDDYGNIRSDNKGTQDEYGGGGYGNKVSEGGLGKKSYEDGSYGDKNTTYDTTTTRKEALEGAEGEVKEEEGGKKKHWFG